MGGDMNRTGRDVNLDVVGVGVGCSAPCRQGHDGEGILNFFSVREHFFVFCVGGLVPPRPPKCAHSGAFHEVVRLDVSCLAWCFVGLGEGFCVWPGVLWVWVGGV